MRTTPFRFLALLLVLITLSGCASFNLELSYPAASNDELARSAAYKQAGDSIKNLRGIGRVTQAQWDEFQAAAAEVKVAAIFVDEDLTIWRETGKKPAGYDGHSKTLHGWQNKALAIAQEVSL